jgi:ribosome maturation factor RimP
MDNTAILSKLEEMVAPVFARLGMELVDRELGMDGGILVLRLYIDKDGGVSLGDCELASRSIGDLIDVEGVVRGSYRLEVSSPGLNRPLKKREDFSRFAGRVIRLKTREPIDGRGNYKGKLLGLEGDDIAIVVDGMKFMVPFDMVAKARIEPEDVFTKQQKKK